MEGLLRLLYWTIVYATVAYAINAVGVRRWVDSINVLAGLPRRRGLELVFELRALHPPNSLRVLLA